MGRPHRRQPGITHPSSARKPIRTRRLSHDEEQPLHAELSDSPRDENSRFELGGSRNDRVKPIIIIRSGPQYGAPKSCRCSGARRVSRGPIRTAARYEERRIEGRATIEPCYCNVVRPPPPHHRPSLSVSADSLTKVFLRACERSVRRPPLP